METYIEIQEPMISAEKVLERWPGVLESELAEMIDRSADLCEDLPPAYRVHKVLKAENGKILAECTVCGLRGSYHVQYHGDSASYDFAGVAFTLADIVNHEQKNPKVLYRIVENTDEVWANDLPSPLATTEGVTLESLSKSKSFVWVKIDPYISLRDLLERWDCDISHINELVFENIIECYEIRSWTGLHENTPLGIRRNPIRGIRDTDRWKTDVGSFVFPLIDIDNFESSAPAQRFAFMRSGPLFPHERSAYKNMEKKIEELETLLANGETNKALAAKAAHIAEFEKELAAAQEAQLPATTTTTVDAAKWENSVKAVLEIWAEIVQGDKTDWKEEEFRTELAKRYSDYHTKVHLHAWSLLPGVFKHGRGRPKKKPEKSQQPDNS